MSPPAGVRRTPGPASRLRRGRHHRDRHLLRDVRDRPGGRPRGRLLVPDRRRQLLGFVVIEMWAPDDCRIVGQSSDRSHIRERVRRELTRTSGHQRTVPARTSVRAWRAVRRPLREALGAGGLRLEQPRATAKAVAGPEIVLSVQNLRDIDSATYGRARWRPPRVSREMTALLSCSYLVPCFSHFLVIGPLRQRSSPPPPLSRS